MNKESIVIQRKEWPFVGLLLLLWARFPIWEYIIGASSYIPIISSFSESIIDVLVIILLLIAFKYERVYIKKTDVLFYGMVVLVFMLNFIFFPENSKTLEFYMCPFLLTVVPYYFVGLCIDIKRYDNLFYLVSCLSVIFQSLYIFGLGKGNVVGNASDDMINHAYNILPHVTYICWRMFRKKDFINITLFGLGFLLQISMANRGSIVCVIAFILFYILFIKRYKSNSRVYVTLATLCICLYLFFQSVALFLYDIMISLKLNTRVLDFVFSSNFIESGGRDDINDVLLKSLEQSPFVLNGIGGEKQLGIVYAHNIYLEWCYAFGILIGSLIFALLVWKVYLAYRRCSIHNILSKGFLVLLVTCGLCPLFFSFTYLVYPLFFMMIGYSVKCARV